MKLCLSLIYNIQKTSCHWSDTARPLQSYLHRVVFTNKEKTGICTYMNMILFANLSNHVFKKYGNELPPYRQPEKNT